MTIQTTAQKNHMALAYFGAPDLTSAVFGAVYTTAAGGTAGTEPTGGSPAYARKSLTPGAPSGGVASATATLDIPASTTIVSGGTHTAVTAGTYLDGGSLTSQTFASQGTYAVTYQYTQT
jgi:hypothetical protein